MSNIIKFPKTKTSVVELIKPTVVPKTKSRFMLASLVNFVWVAVVLVWPILKWILSIYVFFQFIRMFYYWNTPGMFAGWTFLLHFSVLTAITCFVSIYKPKK